MRRVPSSSKAFEEWGDLAMWLGVGDHWYIGPHYEVHLKIGGGEVVAKPGDYIIKEPDGRFRVTQHP